MSDDFDRTDLGDWQALIPTFTVENGRLKGVQTRDDHGAVGRMYRPMKDVVVEFKFKLDGSTGFNAVFDDQKYKGSHAGHICRVAFAAKQIRLGDDKEGIMRNDIFDMRKDPARKAEADKLLEGRGSSAPAAIEPGKWYTVAIEIAGDQMRVSLDGQPGRLSQVARHRPRNQKQLPLHRIRQRRAVRQRPHLGKPVERSSPCVGACW